MPPGLSQSLFGEGQDQTAALAASNAAMAANSYGQGQGTVAIGSGAGSNVAPNTGNGQITGAGMTSNEVSSTTPGVSSGLYANAMNLANAQANNYATQGNAMMTGHGPAAPAIRNPDQAAVMGRLSGVEQGYGTLDAGLSRSAAGGGINAGQAVYQQGQDAALAQAMAASRGRGGMGGALMGAQPALGAAELGGAAARQQQIAAAQGALGASYAGQGGVALGTYGTQQQTAQQQAQLAENQNAMNDQQALSLYNLSQAQQGASAADLQAYNTQAIATENAGTAHQQTNNQQLGTLIGAGLQAGGAVVGSL